MTDDTLLPFDLPSVHRKKLTVDFAGGNQSSDGGLLLLRQAERKLGVCRRLADAMPDRRDVGRIRHDVFEMVMARVSAIACGHEDAIDLDRLRHDPLMKLAVGRCPDSGAPLASQSTISRLENAPSKTEAARLTAALLDQFGTTVKPGKQEILDIDDTFCAAHGGQQLAFWNAHHDERGFASLHIYASFTYQAGSWDRPRKVVARLECSLQPDAGEITSTGMRQEVDIRYVVTSLKGSAQHLYENVYCQRGQMENLIKLHKAQLASDRMSCHSATANQVRLVLHTAAFWLMYGVRAAIPRTNPLAKGEFATIRERLIKIGARVIEHIARIRIQLPTSCPERALFRAVALGLMPSGP